MYRVDQKSGPRISRVFDPVLTHHFCLALPAKFSQPVAHCFSDSCAFRKCNSNPTQMHLNKTLTAGRTQCQFCAVMDHCTYALHHNCTFAIIAWESPSNPFISVHMRARTEMPLGRMRGRELRRAEKEEEEKALPRGFGGHSHMTSALRG